MKDMERIEELNKRLEEALKSLEKTHKDLDKETKRLKIALYICVPVIVLCWIIMAVW